MAGDNPRWIALQAVLQVVQRGRSLDDVFASEWYRNLSARRRDLALSRELAYGYCRWCIALADLLRRRLQKPLRARDLDIEVILILGLYQILFMRTESHAAVYETVNLAHLQRKSWARGLVNAVLRATVRDRIELTEVERQQAYPDWMLARIRRDWGQQANRILDCGNARAPMTLRVDLERTTLDTVIEALEAEEIAVSKHPRVASAVELENPRDVKSIPGFGDGLVSVQDAAAQIAAGLLECDAGARVLDACAAPGGKSAHLLQRYDRIELDVLDRSAVRLESLETNLQRIGRGARIIVGDATQPLAWHDGEPYDRMLVDAPCSASGVIRRHPDIKLLRRERDLLALLDQQRKILDACWRLLKPEGKLLYATCSVFKEENEFQIAKFLARHTDARELPISEVGWGETRSHGRQILTGEDDMDGFYYALIEKRVSV